MFTIPPGVLDAVSRAIEFALAHPHHSVAALAVLSGVLWITSRLLAKRAPVTLNERAAAEAEEARQ
ncbi:MULTISPECIES: hypothetical protein [unclassified Nocardiopsis]|uniref:hypothetical protein n=1 Tax=Nocardiopsis TaxID=2013 RepID=UPI00387AF181